MTKTLLMTQRNMYAEKEGLGLVYLPGSELSFMARVLEVGGDIYHADENIRPANTEGHDNLATSVVGMPTIRDIIKRLRKQLMGNGQGVMLGGVLIFELTTKKERLGNIQYVKTDFEEFRKFFGDRAIACTDEERIAQAIGVDLTELKLQSAEVTSLVKAYEKISDADMKLYLEREISFYLGQGCNKACDFCSAPNAQEERYRKPSIVKDDLTYLTARAKQLGLSQLSMYLSNLDVFQNPKKLEVFFDIVNDLKRNNPDFQYRIRGLAITSSLVITRNKYKRVLDKAVSAGFHTVGMGVDGGNDEIRKNLKKGFVSDANILESMQICKDYGITPETIMVFGGPEETPASMENAYTVTAMLQEKFGALPRPHVFKDLIPGNKYWSGEKYTPLARARKEMLFEDPDYCQGMDFKTLASFICHPNVDQQRLVNKYYVNMTMLCGNERDRKALKFPETPEFSRVKRARNTKRNRGWFDR